MPQKVLGLHVLQKPSSWVIIQTPENITKEKRLLGLSRKCPTENAAVQHVI
jgi:hypothetical protein